MKTVNVVAVGPIGSTFSSRAYEGLALRSGGISKRVNFIPTKSNGDVVEKMFQVNTGGVVHGVLAVETLADGGIKESLFSLHPLLHFQDRDLTVRLGVETKIHLALMARPGVSKKELIGVIAHKRALGACRNNLASLKVETQSVDSNGQGIEQVAGEEKYDLWGAIGPVDSAEKYGLEVIDQEFEDTIAVTTFLLLQKGKTASIVGKRNRAMLLCKLGHRSGSLADLLVVLKNGRFNLTQIHSIPAGNRTCDFLLEIDCDESQLQTWQTICNCLPQVTIAHRCFGPFAVYK